MARITIKLCDSAAQMALRAAMRRCHNTAPAWRDIGEYMVQSVHENFMRGGRPTPWAPWSKSYARWRSEEHAGRGGILRLHMTLMNSISHQPTRSGVRIGTNVSYAAIHQFGGKTRPHVIKSRRAKVLHWVAMDGTHVFRRSVRHPGSEIPARPFFVVQEDDWEEIGRIVLDYVTGPLRHQAA